MLGVPAWEQGLKALRRNDLHMRAVQRFRVLAPFVAEETAEPITDVLPMGALQNVFRAQLVDDRPRVLGLHSVGDSYCHTNPLFAWGLCLGIDYGFELGRIVDEYPSDPEAQLLAFARLTAVEAEQCYRAVADEDRDRSLCWRGEQSEGAWLGRTFADFVRQCALPTVSLDREVAREVIRRANLLDLPDSLSHNRKIVGRITSLQAEVSPAAPGSVPSRDELLQLLGPRA